jgi:hypothetical protein
MAADDAEPLMSPGIAVESPAPVIRERSISEMEAKAVLINLPPLTSFQQAIQYPCNAPVPAHPALSRARSYDCALGHVVLTSGLSRTSKKGSHALDFALISVDAARISGLETMTNVRQLSLVSLSLGGLA